ncbi:MAG: hypothetical protein PHE49_10045 [bacterium]|nr:hypothetical protein [bacterium]
MILTNWPMKFRGTIKGISPEQAKQIFKFDLPPTAKGITFINRKGTTYMVAYIPEHYKNTPRGNPKGNENFRIISKISHSHLRDLIRPIWDKPAQKQNFYSGSHLFSSVNLKRIKTGIHNLLISTGDLEPPKITYSKLKKDAFLFSIDNPQMELGTAILNPQTMSLEHSKPHTYKSDIISLNIETPQTIVFLYYKREDKYSISVSRRMEDYNGNI